MSFIYSNKPFTSLSTGGTFGGGARGSAVVSATPAAGVGVGTGGAEPDAVSFEGRALRSGVGYHVSSGCS